MNKCTRCKELITDKNNWSVMIQMPKKPHPTIIGSTFFCSVYCMSDLTIDDIMARFFKEYPFVKIDYEKNLEKMKNE